MEAVTASDSGKTQVAPSQLLTVCRLEPFKLQPPDTQTLSNTASEWKAGNKVIQLCFFDFTKAAHSNLLRIVIFRSDMLQSKQEADKQKKEECLVLKNLD